MKAYKVYTLGTEQPFPIQAHDYQYGEFFVHFFIESGAAVATFPTANLVAIIHETEDAS